jgi:DNA-binding response OmpR family regulator
MRIAFLDDEFDQAERITSLLREAGHHVHLFGRGNELLKSLLNETYELVLLDWEVPDLSGYEVLQTIRGRMNLQVPVLFVTHRDSEADVVRALNAGADDFLIKPPRERELLARVEAMSRRLHQPAAQVDTIKVAPFHIDLQRRQIERDGRSLELTRREFDVAALLFKSIGTVLSRGFILERVWGRGDAATTRTVDMHVSRVRKVLGLSAAIGLRLIAVYGYGYRLERTGGDPP